ANSRLTADFLQLGRFWPQANPRARERTVRFFCVIYPLLALAIYLLFHRPLTLITIGGGAQMLMLPLIAGASLYLRYRDMDRRVAAGLFTGVMNWVAFLSIAAVALYYILERAQALMARG